MIHTFRKAMPEYRSSGLQAIQGSQNECTLPSIISKFWTKHIPYLFSDLGCQVSILNFSHLDIQIIQIINSLINNFTDPEEI
jgi:hypothetical protein